MDLQDEFIIWTNSVTSYFGSAFLNIFVLLIAISGPSSSGSLVFFVVWFWVKLGKLAKNVSIDESRLISDYCYAY
jgi:hypothetical protein